MMSSISNVVVAVEFIYEATTNADDMENFGMYEIDEITFYVNGVDITEIIWEMRDWDERYWIAKCQKFLKTDKE